MAQDQTEESRQPLSIGIDVQLLNQYLSLQIDALTRQKADEADRKKAVLRRADVRRALRPPFQWIATLAILALIVWLARRGVAPHDPHAPLQYWLQAVEPRQSTGLKADTVKKVVQSVPFVGGTAAQSVPLLDAIPIAAVLHDLPAKETLDWLGAIALTLASLLGLRSADYEFWAKAGIITLSVLTMGTILAFAVAADPLWPRNQSWPSNRYWLMLLGTVIAGVLVTQRLMHGTRMLNSTPIQRFTTLGSWLNLVAAPQGFRRAIVATLRVLSCPCRRRSTTIAFAILPLLSILAFVLDGSGALPAKQLSQAYVDLIDACLILSTVWILWTAFAIPGHLRIVYLSMLIALAAAFTLNQEFSVLTLSGVLAISIPIAVWTSRHEMEPDFSSLDYATVPPQQVSDSATPEAIRPTSLPTPEQAGTVRGGGVRTWVSAPINVYRRIHGSGKSRPRERSSWTIFVLAFGGLLAQLIALIFVIAALTGSDLSSITMLVIFELLALVNVAAAVGVYRRRAWGWVTAVVLGVLWALTVVGVVFSVVLIGGFARFLRRQMRSQTTAASTGT
jgi:hypothetical protein